jgi:hypothetical protein
MVPPIPPAVKGELMFNASVTGIQTRNHFLLWLLRTVAHLCGAEIRLWRSRPRKIAEKVEG